MNDFENLRYRATTVDSYVAGLLQAGKGDRRQLLVVRDRKGLGGCEILKVNVR